MDKDEMIGSRTILNSEESPNIYQRIAKVMEEVKYVKKDARITGGGADYAAVTHDNLVAETRKYFLENGIVIYPVQLRSDILVQRDLSLKVQVKMLLYSGDYAINFVNMDDPKDRIVVDINAHAADNGDKAPGKAITYATKTAILKILQLETGVNDESRTTEPTVYTKEQKDIFDDLIANEEAMGMVCFDKQMGPDIMTSLFNSFEKGKISSSKATVKALTEAGWDKFREYKDLISEGVANKDPALEELVAELTSGEKRILMKMIDQREIDYLTNMARKG